MQRQITINLFNFAGQSNTIHMQPGFFLTGIKNILFDPVKAWEVISSENRSMSLLKYGYLLPLVILVSAAGFAGSLLFTNSEQPVLYSLLVGIRLFLSFYVSVYLSSLILKEITYPLDLGRDFNTSFRLVVYSITPLLICQLFSRIFESLLFVNILSLYGFYIFWTGAEKLLNPPGYKKMPLLIAAFLEISAFMILTDLIFAKLTNKIYYAFFA
jgi:hypothetical protein